jgi:hypothetical protein
MAKLSDFRFFINDYGLVWAYDTKGNEYAVSDKLYKVPKGSIDGYWGGATDEEVKAAIARGKARVKARASA